MEICPLLSMTAAMRSSFRATQGDEPIAFAVAALFARGALGVGNENLAAADGPQRAEKADDKTLSDGSHHGLFEDKLHRRRLAGLDGFSVENRNARGNVGGADVKVDALPVFQRLRCRGQQTVAMPSRQEVPR